MPKVHFFREGITCDAEPGENLRALARRVGVDLYRSWHKLLNCRAKGKCGSCRVEVSLAAAVSPAERTPAEHKHLDGRFSDAATRLACQVCVDADVSVLTQPIRGKRIETRSFIPRGF